MAELRTGSVPLSSICITHLPLPVSSIYSRFDEYDDEQVLLAYLNRHYRSAFRRQEETEFLKQPATSETEQKAERIRERVTDRMLSNLDKIRVRRCPKCDRILETPRALQCLWCKHKFHDQPRPPSQVRRRIETKVKPASDREEEDVPHVTEVRVRSELRDGASRKPSVENSPNNNSS